MTPPPTAHRAARRTIGLVLAALVGSLLVGAGTGAGAAAPQAQAWWYIARSSELPIATPVPPTVDDDGLYIAAGPNGALAVAALRAQVGDVAGAQITLEIADASGEVVIGACRTSPWFPTQAGNWEDRPDPDCDAGSVAGVVADDASSVTFDVGALVEGGTLDVVLLPGTGEEGTPSNFTASIAPPDDGTLSTSSAPAPIAPPSTVASPTPAPAPGAPAPVSPPAQTSSPSFTPAGGAATVPEPETAVSVPPAAPIEQAATPRPLARPAATTAGSVSDNGRILGVGLALLVAAAYVVLRSREGPVPAPLLAIGASRGRMAAATAVAAGEHPTVAPTVTTSGVGRFARERTGRPPPLT